MILKFFVFELKKLLKRKGNNCSGIQFYSSLLYDTGRELFQPCSDSL